MKNFFKYIPALAAAIIAASCASELRQAAPDGEQAGDSVGVQKTFTCSFAGVKTVLKDGEGSTRKVEWAAGDQIRILCIDSKGSPFSIVASADSDGPVADFPVTLPDADAYYAVYPSTAASTSSLDSEGHITVTVPAENAAGTFAAANISVAKAEIRDGKDFFSFRNAASILKFAISENDKVVELTECANGTLAGEIVASFDAEGNLVTSKGSALSSVIRTAPLDSGMHYVAVIPTDAARGVAMRTSSDSPAFFDDGPITFTRGHIVNVGNISEKVIKDYYITQSGAGDKSGRNWENAGTAQTVKTVLHRKFSADDDNAVRMRSWKAQGTVFHFAAGKYVFGDGTDDGINGLRLDFWRNENGEPVTEGRVKIAFLGGYPAAGGSEDQRAPKANKSVLSGDNLYRILQVRDLVDLTLDGLTFSEATASSSTNASASTGAGKSLTLGTDYCGSAIYLSDYWDNTATYKAREALTRPHVDINNCEFCNNTNTSSGSGTGNGRTCIALAKGQCHVTNCWFHDNSASAYGIVGAVGGGGYVENATRGELWLNACVFENNRNTASTSYGNVTYNNSKGSYIGFYNCTFRNNFNTDKTDYGVIYVSRNQIVANCTFVETVPVNVNNDSTSTSSARLAVIRFTGDILGCREHTVVNNIIIDDGDNQLPCSIYVNNSSQGIITGNGGPERYAILNPQGGNLLTGYLNSFATATSGNIYGKFDFVSDYDLCDASAIRSATLGLQWDDNDKVFKWPGKVNGFSGVDKTFVQTSINSNSDIGDLFYLWLEEIQAFDKDALGNTRTGAWTPGAYQVNQ